MQVMIFSQTGLVFQDYNLDGMSIHQDCNSCYLEPFDDDSGIAYWFKEDVDVVVSCVGRCDKSQKPIRNALVVPSGWIDTISHFKHELSCLRASRLWSKDVAEILDSDINKTGEGEKDNG
jgi:hypothetical protein